jgi:peptidyl-prolyl cis-trans isomerase D
MASFAAKQAERIKGGEPMTKLAKELGGSVARTAPFKRADTPAGLPGAAVQQAFALPKGGATSVVTADGRSRLILRVAEVTPAPPPTAEQTKAMKEDVAKQVRVDLLEQYVGGLRTRYGYTINEALLKQALGPQTEQPQGGFDD